MADHTRIEHRHDGRTLYIALEPDGVWARSEFPHPLVTVDYNEDDCVIGIGAVGSRIVGTLDIYTRCVEEALRSDQRCRGNVLAEKLAAAA